MKRMNGLLCVAVCAVIAAAGLHGGDVLAREGSGAAPAAPSSTKKFEFLKEWTYAQNARQWDKIMSIVGKPAPELTVGAWSNGEQSLSSLKGKIVLVDFWATWCNPCRKAVPKNNSLAEKYAPQGVVVMGICGSNEKGGGTMGDSVASLKIKYSTAQDQQSKTEKAWNVQWWPYYVLVDREGVVRAAGLSVDSVETAIKALLEEQPSK